MDAQESRVQEMRVKTYRALAIRRNQIQKAIDQVTTDRPDDPNKTGPFTGNHRESRQIQSLHIFFTATRGQSPPVEMLITDLGIEARHIQKALLVLLHQKAEEVRNEMEKL